MGAPLKKKHFARLHPNLNRPERILKLVRPNPTPPRQKKAYKGLWKFLLATAIATGLLLYYNQPTDEQNDQVLLNSARHNFFALDDVYRQEGIQRFLEEKNALKQEIAQTLRNPKNEAEEYYASNVAVYLFPDVLPDSDFEKQIALEQWAPLQNAIEKTPRSANARLWFEEMRSNIWNYENPRVEALNVSPFASQVLGIYNDLSAP